MKLWIIRWTAILVLVCAAAIVGTQGSATPKASGQQVNSDTRLEPGKPVERELAGGQSHSYRFVITAGQYLQAVVDQRGIDVNVALFGPDGNKLTEVNTPTGLQGPETVYWITAVSGSYRLEVRSLEKDAPPGKYEAKIEALREATDQDWSRAAQNVHAEGERLRLQGRAESLREAVTKFEQALPLWRAAGGKAGEAATLNSIGLAFYFLGEQRKALDYYNQSLVLERAGGDRLKEGVTLNNIGLVYSGLGETQKAMDSSNQALLIARSVGSRVDEAFALSNIARVYSVLGKNQEALAYQHQTLTIVQSLGDRKAEAVTLNNIGLLYSDLGEKQKALEYYDRALPLLRTIGDLREQGVTLQNIGAANDALGQKQKAIDYLNQALPLRRAAGDRNGEAFALIGIGVIYSSLGEKQKALGYYGQALTLLMAVNNRQFEATALHSIGAIYFSLGEKQKALDYLNQALVLGRAVADRRREGLTLAYMGLVYFDLNEKQMARDSFEQALPILRAVGDRFGESFVLNNVGFVYSALGEKQRALDSINEALLLQRAVGDRDGEAKSFYNLARVEGASADLPTARTHIENALSIVEGLRTNVISQDLRASYHSTVQQYYEFYIDLLMRLHKQEPFAGYGGKALQANERGRARSLLELLTESHADIYQGVNAQLLERERSLQRLLNSKTERQIRLLSGKHIDAQVAEVVKEIDALKTEYQQVEAEIKAKSPRYAALTQPQPLSVEQIQQLLDKDSLLLEYSLGDKHSYLWAVSQSAVNSYELPKRAEIETAARQFYEALTAPNQEIRSGNRRLIREEDAQVRRMRETADILSRMLLEPVASQLEKKRLVIVGDGGLQYVPFAALPEPATERTAFGEQESGNPRPLIVNHEIVNLPSASVLAVIRREIQGRRPAEKAVAVLADPVFDRNDERIASAKAEKKTDGLNEKSSVVRQLEREKIEKAAAQTGVAQDGLRIPRLPGTRQEAKKILAFAPAGAGMKALDFEASKATANSPELSQYRYVHFATHGFLNSVNPELSGIVLSMIDQNGQPQNGFLLANEVFNLNLPAELVVLSACQTGLGKEIRGEGLVGLTRGFMYAGAPRVVVSL